MTMTESALYPVPTTARLASRGVQTVRTEPADPAALRTGRGCGAPLRSAADAITSMTAVSSPTGGGGAEPDRRRRSAAADMATEDWNLLFRAALELLAGVAVEKAASDGTSAQLHAPGTALRECIDALDQLRRSLPPHGFQQMHKVAPTEGESTLTVPAPEPGSDRGGLSGRVDARTGSGAAIASP